MTCDRNNSNNAFPVDNNDGIIWLDDLDGHRGNDLRTTTWMGPEGLEVGAMPEEQSHPRGMNDEEDKQPMTFDNANVDNDGHDDHLTTTIMEQDGAKMQTMQGEQSGLRNNDNEDDDADEPRHFLDHSCCGACPHFWTIVIGIIMPLWLLVFISYFFGFLLSKAEAPGEGKIFMPKKNQ